MTFNLDNKDVRVLHNNDVDVDDVSDIQSY